MKNILSSFAAVCILAVALAAQAFADPLDTLRAQVAQIGEMVGGNVGASIAIDGSDPIPLINGDKRFLFMSTVKTLVAIEALKQVEDGKLSLDKPVEITQDDLAVMTPINMTFPRGTTTTPLYNVIWTSIVDSDNSAPNVLMRLMDGPKGVEKFFNERGVTDLSVDRSIRDLLIYAYQVKNIDGVIAHLAEKDKLPGGSGAYFLDGSIESPIYQSDKDTITPDAMVRILSMLVDGKVLDAERTNVLISIMEQTRTGPKRLKGMLPPGTVVGHKTGTGHRSVNDTGWIRLPDGRTLVIAVFTTSKDPYDVREAVIAQIARAAYDYAMYSK